MNNGQRSNILSEKFIRESSGFLVVMPAEARIQVVKFLHSGSGNPEL